MVDNSACSTAELSVCSMVDNSAGNNSAKSKKNNKRSSIKSYFEEEAENSGVDSDNEAGSSDISQYTDDQTKICTFHHPLTDDYFKSVFNVAVDENDKRPNSIAFESVLYCEEDTHLIGTCLLFLSFIQCTFYLLNRLPL